MTNSPPSIVPPDILSEDKEAVHSFLHLTYAETKKQLQHGINLFREEFTSIQSKAEEYLHYLSLPVNNFLKDLSQIEKELEFELKKETPPVIEPAFGCNFIAIEKLSLDNMEENY